MAARWDIRREGREWNGAEFRARWELTPEKLEVIDGRLFWNEAERVNLLAMLLENVGLDTAVRLGDPQAWNEAFTAAKGQPRELESRTAEDLHEEED
jgi:hypothetical protein